jgi:hypothetical protein
VQTTTCSSPDRRTAHRALMAEFGPETLAALAPDLTDDELAEFEALLARVDNGRPVRGLVMAALDENGGIADQAAFNVLVALTDRGALR